MEQPPPAPALALLQEAATALIATPLDIEPILSQITALAVPRLGDLAMIYLLRAPATLERLAVVHRDPAKEAQVRELQRRYPPDLNAPLGLARVLRTGRSELIERTPDRHFAPLMVDDVQRALVAAIGPRSYITVALQADGVIFGAIQLVITESERSYGPDELATAEALAHSCALALRNARLHADLRAAHEASLTSAARVDQLRQLVEELNAATLPEDVARTVAERGARAVGARTSALALRGAADGALIVAHAFGYPPEVIASWRTLAVDQSTPLGDAAHTGEPIWLESLAARQGRYPQLSAAHAATGPGGLACLPLMIEGRVIGVLGIGFGTDQAFDAETRSLLLTLAHQCALALERARLYGAEREARERAEVALTQRDQFLAAAAHELRTPLTSLLGNAQLLARRAAMRGEAGSRESRMLSVMVGQTVRLNSLISTLLTVSELDAGQLTLARAPIDMCALGRRVLAELEPFAEGHTLTCDAPDESILVLGDETRLAALLEALARNAVAASPIGGPVAMRVEERAGWVEVTVVDQGRGIPAEMLPQIFERYYRPQEAGPAGVGGLGVNLWLAREIAQRHGGSLVAHSEVDAGSTFILRLPAWNPVPATQDQRRRP